ncbi:hypothetical protein J6590_014923 [Homalodisca vitripennis]|nr:hypothetical protein J6590_014923 [Homalodisca vitripennis]
MTGQKELGPGAALHRNGRLSPGTDSWKDLFSSHHPVEGREEAWRGAVTCMNMKRESETTTVLGDTERWFMNTCPRRQVSRFINSLPDSMKNVQTPKALKLV